VTSKRFLDLKMEATQKKDVLFAVPHARKEAQGRLTRGGGGEVTDDGGFVAVPQLGKGKEYGENFLRGESPSGGGGPRRGRKPK